MRNFGYLDSSSTTTTSETLYHEEAIIGAIKKMQKYGALNETGVLDIATLKVGITYQIYIFVTDCMKDGNVCSY